ncbi:MAG: hypothetical protein ACLQQ4_06885 [Bacteroidia bacterium]
MKTLRISMLISGMALLFASCSKDGATGPAGPTGTAGANGVANISSTIYNVPTADWGASITGYGYEDTIKDAAIKNADSDAVEVFIEPVTGYFLNLSSNNVYTNGDEMNFTVATGKVDLFYITSPAHSIVPPTSNFKVVVIPPTVIRQYPNTNWKDYAAIMAIMDKQTAGRN